MNRPDHRRDDRVGARIGIVTDVHTDPTRHLQTEQFDPLSELVVLTGAHYGKIRGESREFERARLRGVGVHQRIERTPEGIPDRFAVGPLRERIRHTLTESCRIARDQRGLPREEAEERTTRDPGLVADRVDRRLVVAVVDEQTDRDIDDVRAHGHSRDLPWTPRRAQHDELTIASLELSVILDMQFQSS
nr:hypothetical protein [Pseudoclavibacter chungangensis]